MQAWAENVAFAAIPRPRATLSLFPRPFSSRGVVLSQHIREGRFQRALSLVAGAAGLLGGLEVTLEHYRGSYGDRWMYTPVALSVPLAAAGVGALYSRTMARTLLPVASIAMLADGVIGFAYHVRGVARRPGGWRLPVFNVVMGPPLFAPLLLGVGGFLGLVASGLRREDDPPAPLSFVRRSRSWLRSLRWPVRHRFVVLAHATREGKLQRIVSWATAASALLNGFEALYSHDRNAFKHKSEWLPVIASPLIAAAGVGAVYSARLARTALPVLSAGALALGGLGFYYHVRGVARRPGNPRHTFYNLVYGPPAMAPLLFAATGFLGLVASQLRRR